MIHGPHDCGAVQGGGHEVGTVQGGHGLQAQHYTVSGGYITSLTEEGHGLVVGLRIAQPGTVTAAG